MKIYLSPSSQESNIGLSGGYIEEKVMNEITDILYPELIRHGLEVKRNNPALLFWQHVIESNAWKPDYHIAIHSNAVGSNTQATARGCMVFTYDPNVNALDTQMAKSIYKYLEPLTPVDDRGILSGKDTLSEISDTVAPAVLIEIDFHDNPDGATWIIGNVAKIANAILVGILDQCGIKFIPETAPAKSFYRVQVGAYAIEENAIKMKNRLIAAGFPAIIVSEGNKV